MSPSPPQQVLVTLVGFKKLFKQERPNWNNANQQKRGVTVSFALRERSESDALEKEFCFQIGVRVCP